MTWSVKERCNVLEMSWLCDGDKYFTESCKTALIFQCIKYKTESYAGKIIE